MPLRDLIALIRRRAALNGTLQSNVRQATHWLQAEGVVVPRNPMVGSFPGCCARAPSGQTAAPSSSVMKSRRFNCSNCIRSPSARAGS
jgi:hypothetical protein